ncbi:hypothetical protein V1477_010545 [Vespula maculifrons]|uniref:Uncharacterized protein n=1 Tax=Vespula maculifrons TaxID=7453 RepID=A0ABD2C288_VESMC
MSVAFVRFMPRRLAVCQSVRFGQRGSYVLFLASSGDPSRLDFYPSTQRRESAASKRLSRDRGRAVLGRDDVRLDEREKGFEKRDGTTGEKRPRRHPPIGLDVFEPRAGSETVSRNTQQR